MKQFFKPEPVLSLGLAALILGIGIALGAHFEAAKYLSYLHDFQITRQTDDPYPLVAPLIGADFPSALKVGDYTGVASDIRAYAAKNVDEVDSYALYYRDLNSSEWFGINEDSEYIPASLLKIAIAFVVLKKEESNPAIANARELYTPTIARINTSEPDLAVSELVVGQSYATHDLIEKMLVDSDNGAKDLLYSEVSQSDFYGLFRLVGVEEPTDPSTYQLSPQEYASFLRMLYNGTYLSSEDSEQVLDLLARSTFTQGLVAGVPGNIPVAHKYGTFTLTDSSGQKTGIELHDCGIVYHPTDPYILCVMTKGQDADQLAGFIAGISSIVYGDVAARQP